MGALPQDAQIITTVNGLSSRSAKSHSASLRRLVHRSQSIAMRPKQYASHKYGWISFVASTNKARGDIVPLTSRTSGAGSRTTVAGTGERLRLRAMPRKRSHAMSPGLHSRTARDRSCPAHTRRRRCNAPVCSHTRSESYTGPVGGTPTHHTRRPVCPRGHTRGPPRIPGRCRSQNLTPEAPPSPAS